MKPMEQEKLNRLLAFLADEKKYVFLDSVRIDSESYKSALFLEPVGRLDFYQGDDTKLGIVEQVLSRKELQLAEAIFCRNSVGDVVQVRLAEEIL
jgi:hypothetical protein